MDRKIYRNLEEGSSSVLKTSFLSACKEGSGMRFLLCRGRQATKWPPDHGDLPHTIIDLPFLQKPLSANSTEHGLSTCSLSPTHRQHNSNLTHPAGSPNMTLRAHKISHSVTPSEQPFKLPLFLTELPT